MTKGIDISQACGKVTKREKQPIGAHQMDNIQLAVLLEHIAHRLAAGLINASLNLPADVARQPVEYYTGSQSEFARLDSRNWETRCDGLPVALSELDELLRALQQQTAALYGKKDGAI